MDLNLLADNASSKLQIIRDALMKRKGFISFFDDLFGLYVMNMVKCTAVTYGSWKYVPIRVTFIFLSSVVCLQVFVGAEWYVILGEIFHALLQMLSLVYAPEEEGYVPHSLWIWCIYSAFQKAEFYFDCYLLVAIFFFLTQKFADRPHHLSTLICILYAANYLARLFVDESNASLFFDLHVFYVPAIIMYAFNQNIRGQNFFCLYIAMWVSCELTRTDVNSTAGRFIRSAIFYFRDKDIYDVIDASCRQKSFLNVDEKEHLIFYSIMFVKSFAAAYATRNIVGVIMSTKLMFVNWILTFFSGNVTTILSGLIRLLINAGFQRTFHVQHYSMISSSGIWLWVCFKNDHYHLFLDVFLIISALFWILKAYEDNLHEISSLICLLWLAEWYSDAFVVEPLGRMTTVATLYLPALLISAHRALNFRHRTLTVLAFILLWFVFKCEKEQFENSLKMRVHNTEEKLENFCMIAVKALVPYRVWKYIEARDENI